MEYNRKPTRCKITYYAVHRRSCCWIEILKYKFPNLKDVRANCFCASLLRTRITCHVMHRARALSTKMNKWKGRRPLLQPALLGINDLGRPVTRAFLFRNRFYLQLSTHCPKLNKKSMWEVKKKFKISVHGTWNSAILRLQVFMYVYDANNSLLVITFWRYYWYLLACWRLS